jgi:hypothetical protein
MGLMKIIDHGEWVAYKPENYPVKLPPNILFAQRASDGVDWYMFQRSELVGSNNLFVVTVPADDGGLSVITTTYDPTTLFPTAGMRLFEVIDPPEGDHEKLRTQRLDLKRKRFVAPPPHPPSMLSILIEELGLDETKLRAKLDAKTKGKQHG